MSNVLPYYEKIKQINDKSIGIHMEINLSKKQTNILVIFRLLIGWHFLYEGVTKLYNPGWTSVAYLNSATGPFKGLFVWLSGDGMITMVDYLNIIGLVGIGLALILGFWERIAGVAGFILLLFYYFSQPPFPGVEQIGTEGNYFLVNKNLIEAIGLLVIYYFPTGKYFGISLLFGKKVQPQVN